LENPSSEAPRLHQLDALRGLASLTVLFLHFVDMFFPYDRTAQQTPSQHFWLTLLRPFYGGHEAVNLFFVLSGFVLALPYIKGKSQSYSAFVVRRIARIYLPYLVALALALLGASIWHGHLQMGDWAEICWSQPINPKLVIQHSLFLGNYDTEQYNVVFWTLVYEMRVSIVFPLLIAFVLRMRFIYAALMTLACPLIYLFAIHYWPWTEATMLTVSVVGAFVCGILLAQHMDKIRIWYRSLSGLQRNIFAIVSLVFYNYGTNYQSRLNHVLIVSGAVGLIILAIYSDSARRLLQRPVPMFLGKISYSLYLVHATVLFTLVFLLHTKVSRTTIFILYVPLALGLATIFHRIVEEPSIWLSRRWGKLMDDRSKSRQTI
jgi:peptidoglycan/LPS O-acetylase OafA/YrhL